MPFVEFDAEEIESLFTDVEIPVNGISDYIVGRS
jgi:hypothetical protein